MNKETIMGFLRHVLTFGGGFAVAKGYIDAEMLEQAVGALIALVGVFYSVKDKKARA